MTDFSRYRREIASTMTFQRSVGPGKTKKKTKDEEEVGKNANEKRVAFRA